MPGKLSSIKRIEDNGEDFDMFFEDRYIGSRRTEREAQRELDALAYETLRRTAIETSDAAAEYQEAIAV